MTEKDLSNSRISWAEEEFGILFNCPAIFLSAINFLQKKQIPSCQNVNIF